MAEEAKPAWITTGSTLFLNGLINHCRASPLAFASAVETAMERSKQWLQGESDVELSTPLVPLPVAEEQAVLHKLAENFSVNQLSLLCEATGDLPETFDTFQIFANKILIICPTIASVRLTLIDNQEEGNEVVPFRFDFLRPRGVPLSLTKFVLSLSGHWCSQAPLLLGVLCRCKEVDLERPEMDPGITAACETAEFLSVLLSPESSVRRLRTLDYRIFSERLCLSELSKTLGNAAFGLESLTLTLNGNDGSGLAQFSSAVGQNTTLKELTICLTSHWTVKLLVDVAVMLSVNQFLEKLCLSAKADNCLGFLALIAAVALHPKLQYLGLSGFREIDDECALLLAHQLQQPGRCRALRRVELARTSVGRQGALALAACPSLLHLDLFKAKITSDTVCAMIDQCPVLPNLDLSSDSIGIKAAVAIGKTIGRSSILLHEGNPSCLPLIQVTMRETMSEPLVNDVVPDCIVEPVDARLLRAIELFKNHAQLKQIWFVNCNFVHWAVESEVAELELYQTLNRRLPTDLRQKIIDGTSIRPTEWCEALGAVKNDSLDCVYHIFAQWRLEGTTYHLVASLKRKAPSRGHDSSKRTREGSKSSTIQ